MSHALSNAAAPERTAGVGRGKKPIHIEGVRQSGQDAVWQGVRKLKNFSDLTIENWLKKKTYKEFNRYTIRCYLRRLVNGGYLSITKTEYVSKKARIHHFELIRDTGAIAPKVRKDGNQSRQGKGQENLWRSMKILKEFNINEITLFASTSKTQIKESSAGDYVRRLASAGYLKVAKQQGNLKGEFKRYRFLPSKDTGPFPPKIQKSKAVFDVNLNKVVWEPKAKEVSNSKK